MKKTILISALAFAAAVFAGCSKENPNVSPANESGNVAGSKVCAYLDKVKAHLDGVNMTWSQGDRMKVRGYDEWLIPSPKSHFYVLDEECAGKSKGTFSLQNGQTPAQSENVKKFFGIVNGNGGFAGGGSESATNLYLVYTIPENQNYVENGIEDNIMPLYAYGDALDNMQVYYCGSILSIQLYSKSTEDVYVSEIKVSSVNYFAGQQYVNCYSNPTNPCWGKYSSNPNNPITLSMDEPILISKDGEHPTVFNVVVAGKQQSASFTIDIFTTGTATMRLDRSSLDIVPGTIYRMASTEFSDNYAPNHVNLSLNGGTATCIEDVVSIPEGTSTVKVTVNDGKVLSALDISLLAILFNNASEPGIITLDLSDVSFVDNIFPSLGITWSRINKLILPKSITAIATSLSGVKDLVISEGITTIANSVLSGVTGTVSIPASVSSIAIGNNYSQSAYVVAEGNTAYQSVDGVLFNKGGETVNLVYYPGGNSATEYTIPSKVGGKSVTKVEYTAFQYCQNLETLTVPASVADMSSSITGAEKLNKIILQGTETKLNSVTYSDSNFDGLFKIYNGTVICPAGSRPSYINGTNGAGWKRLYELRNWTFDDGTSPM